MLPGAEGAPTHAHRSEEQVPTVPTVAQWVGSLTAAAWVSIEVWVRFPAQYCGLKDLTQLRELPFAPSAAIKKKCDQRRAGASSFGTFRG